jgi:hypothetical protein
MHTHASKRDRARARARPGSAPVLLALFLIAAWCGWSGAAARQEPPGGEPSSAPVPEETPVAAAPRQGEPAEGAPSQGSAGESIPPEAQSSYLVRTYKVRPAKLWKELLESLKAEGHPPEEIDEEKRTVKTSFVDFKQDDYLLQVGDPPRLIGGDYHIVQLLKVRQGKVSLEGVVTPAKEGAELKMRARILVTGLDRVKQVRVLVDRRSTGVIESDFIHKLEARHGLEHL